MNCLPGLGHRLLGPSPQALAGRRGSAGMHTRAGGVTPGTRAAAGGSEGGAWGRRGGGGRPGLKWVPRTPALCRLPSFQGSTAAWHKSESLAFLGWSGQGEGSVSGQRAGMVDFTYT